VPLTDLQKLDSLIARDDLSSLQNLASATPRIQNRSLSFRSAMMLSAHNTRHLSKIPSVPAECLMLNLEDGVAPEQKPYALALCAIALAANPKSDKKLVVRVNPLDEGGEEEIAYLNPFMPDGIRIPKIRTAEEVRRASSLIAQGIELHLSIETKEAWLALEEIASVRGIAAYYLGVLDLFADLGLAQSLLHPDNPTVHYMLARFLTTARACGIKPVSFVYQNHKNLDCLRNWLELEKMMGFDAKGCISPAQAELIHEIFGHSEAELKRAKEIVELFREHAARGVTGFVHDVYGFIDEPIYKGALAVLDKR